MWGDTQQEVKRQLLFVKPACCGKWSMLIQTEYDRNGTPRAKLVPGAAPVTQRQMIWFPWTYARSELDPQRYVASNSMAKKPEIHHRHPNRGVLAVAAAPACAEFSVLEHCHPWQLFLVVIYPMLFIAVMVIYEKIAEVLQKYKLAARFMYFPDIGQAVFFLTKSIGKNKKGNKERQPFWKLCLV